MLLLDHGGLVLHALFLDLGVVVQLLIELLEDDFVLLFELVVVLEQLVVLFAELVVYVDDLFDFVRKLGNLVLEFPVVFLFLFVQSLDEGRPEVLRVIHHVTVFHLNLFALSLVRQP